MTEDRIRVGAVGANISGWANAHLQAITALPQFELVATCTTRMESKHGEVACDWELADVTRPLHSVSQIAGPLDGPGKFDILFNNKRCIVVPPGVVEQIARRLQGRIQAEYPREGNLYVGDMTISGFGRQGTQE